MLCYRIDRQPTIYMSHGWQRRRTCESPKIPDMLPHLQRYSMTTLSEFVMTCYYGTQPRHFCDDHVCPERPGESRETHDRLQGIHTHLHIFIIIINITTTTTTIIIIIIIVIINKLLSSLSSLLLLLLSIICYYYYY